MPMTAEAQKWTTATTAKVKYSVGIVVEWWYNDALEDQAGYYFGAMW